METKGVLAVALVALLVGVVGGYVLDTPDTQVVEVPVEKLVTVDKFVEVPGETVYQEVPVDDPVYDYFRERYEVAEACYGEYKGNWEEELTVGGADYDDWVESNNQELDVVDEPDFSDAHDVLQFLSVTLVDLDDNEWDCNFNSTLRDEDRNEYTATVTVNYEDGELDDLEAIA